MSKRNFVAPCGKGFAQANSLSRHQPMCEKCQEILKANVPPPGGPSPTPPNPSLPMLVSPDLEAARAETESKIAAMEGRIAERMTQLEQGMAQAIIASANTIETKIGSRVSKQLGQLIPQAIEGWLKANIPLPNTNAENSPTQVAPAQTAPAIAQAVAQQPVNGQQSPANLQGLVMGLLQVADSSPTLQMGLRLLEKKIMGGGRAGVGSKDWWDGVLWTARTAKTKQRLDALEKLGENLGFTPSATVAAITAPQPVAPKLPEVKV